MEKFNLSSSTWDGDCQRLAALLDEMCSSGWSLVTVLTPKDDLALVVFARQHSRK